MLALWIAALAVLAAGRPAEAQPSAPAARRPAELSLGGSFLGQTSFGSLDAELLRSDGTPTTIFRTETALRPGFGLEAHLGFGLSKALWAEASGTWTRADFRTEVSGDIEGVGTAVLTESVFRFGVDGSVLWLFAQRGKATWFVRGGAGWMRELTGRSSLLEDGLVGHAGVGVKYLWKDPARARFSPVGFRIEGRALLRSGGLSIGEDRVRFTPVVAGSLIIGL